MSKRISDLPVKTDTFTGNELIPIVAEGQNKTAKVGDMVRDFIIPENMQEYVNDATDAADRAMQSASEASSVVEATLGSFSVKASLEVEGYAIAFIAHPSKLLLGGIKKDGTWKLALADESLFPNRLENPVINDLNGLTVEALSDNMASTWANIIKSSNGKIIAATRKSDGKLRVALTEDSIVPLSAVGGLSGISAELKSLLLAGRQAPVSGRLFFSGDSLTAGAGGAGTSYPLIMANRLGLSYVNTAVGGTRTASIGVRQGGVPMVITLAADLPTTTDEIDVATYSEEFTNNQGSQTIQGRLIFTDNTPDVLVTMRRYGTVANAAITEKYTIARRTAGGEAFEIPPGTIFVSDAAYGNELDFHYIQTGQNDDKSTRAKRTQLRDYILQMVDRIGHDRFCILGQKYVSVGEAAAGSQKQLFNQELHDTFGDHFAWSEVAYMGSQKLFDDYGLTPTSEDLTYIAAGAVAPSLRVDAVHGNATYYTAQGEFMARWHRARGWHFNKGV